MAILIWVNIGSGNGVLFLTLQHIVWINMDFSFVGFCGIPLTSILQRVPNLLICMMSLKLYS